MEIDIEFPIGYECWVPRVKWIYHEHSIEIDGKTYTRETKELYAFAKQKTIVEIQIEIDELCTQITYWCKDAVHPNVLATKISPADMKYQTHQHALDVAENWLNTHNAELFG